jgi:hypothetical protein
VACCKFQEAEYKIEEVTECYKPYSKLKANFRDPRTPSWSTVVTQSSIARRLAGKAFKREEVPQNHRAGQRLSTGTWIMRSGVDS